MTVEGFIFPFLTGFGAGAVSGFVQFWTKLKDENEDGVVDWKDFKFSKFGVTVIVSGTASGYFTATGVVIDPYWAGVLGAGTERMIRIVVQKVKQLVKQLLSRE